MWREKKELGGGEESREGQEPDEVPDSQAGAEDPGYGGEKKV